MPWWPFQKVEGRARTGNLTGTELKALQSATRPRARYEGFAHIEIDVTRQVLFVIDESGTVSRILPVSSGNEGRYVDRGQVHRAHTPRGTFKVLRKINGLSGYSRESCCLTSCSACRVGYSEFHHRYERRAA